jgi:hypothetical protein
MADYRGPLDATGMTVYLKEDSQVSIHNFITKRSIHVDDLS